MQRENDNVIRVVGARQHNLRSVSLTLPKGRLICFTGVSGSGKSSMAFDTIYAEGQRRYIESLSSYARQFLSELPKPEVDQISGLAPSISIQQKTSGWNPRSTVGTITQIHDYLRVLFARAGDASCPRCGSPITSQTREHMLARILTLPAGTNAILLAPRVRASKGEHVDLFEELTRQGFVRARVDGQMIELSRPPTLDRNRRHDIEVVIDRLVIRPERRGRLAEALDLALATGNGVAIVAPEGGADILLSSGYACGPCGVSYEPPHPQMFSFNSPQGMCPRCDGLGTCFDFDPDMLVPDKTQPFFAPAIAAFRTKPGKWRRHLYRGVAEHVGFDIERPWKELSPSARKALLFGTGDDHITFTWKAGGRIWKHGGKFEGAIAELQAAYKKSQSAFVRRFYEQYMRQTPCPVCHGARLVPQALAVRLTGKGPEGTSATVNLHEFCRMSIADALTFIESLLLDDVRKLIAREPLKEIRARLRFLLDVGLDYLTLDRSAPTLSGGESQRIRLASQIGSGLMGVVYVLDEPSIGLHPRDNERLLASLHRLRDMGNTVIVVEHDRDTMEAADWIVDFGPGPGVRGGYIVAEGELDDVRSAKESLTGAFLAERETIAVPASRRPVTPPPSAATHKKSSRSRRPV